MDSIDTTSAFGRAMVGILAVLAELELEQGKERSASARRARADRHAAAGIVGPSSTPAYGYRHVTSNGLTRVELDDSVDLSVVVAAYAEAGSVRKTAVLLNERGPCPSAFREGRPIRLRRTPGRWRRRHTARTRSHRRTGGPAQPTKQGRPTRAPMSAHPTRRTLRRGCSGTMESRTRASSPGR